jgi:GNAT superfamily N-acetyltransferase
MRRITARGSESRELVVRLLQRQRIADPAGGIWEAADVQWWGRESRSSDDVDQLFWVDDEGPVAGILMTSWRQDRWQCDPITPTSGVDLASEEVWANAHDLIHQHARGVIEVNVRDDDQTAVAEAAAHGLVPAGQTTICWMDPARRPAQTVPPAAFTIGDRMSRSDSPHPMIARNGPDVARHLEQCSLYDSRLDLVVEDDLGHVAGYSLYWFDPQTKVGYVEPMRVEEGFQRQGLATAMLTEGLSRLVELGARRLKILFDTDGAGGVYQRIGFRPEATFTTYQAPLH